jgi:ATP-dependent DNA ligase I
VLLEELARTSEAVAATASRRAKIDAISSLLRRAEPGEVPAVVAFLSGELLQRQIGVGYAALGDLLRQPPPAAAGPDGARSVPLRPLTVAETDAVFSAIGEVSGAGTQAERRRLLAGLFGRARGGERDFLARLLAGDLRQGALEGVMAEAVARAAAVPAPQVRRAHLLTGSLPLVAQVALTAARQATGEEGDGERREAATLAALRSLGLRVGRPLRPMLASSAGTVAAALERISPAVVEWKIDGIRVQVHRDGAGVSVFTRTLDDITGRVPEITEAVLALDVRTAVLDGEVVALRPGGRPRPFQVTASRTGSQLDVARQREQVPLTAFYFDLLHLDGADLIDEPAHVRFAHMARVLPADLIIPRLVTSDLAAAAEFYSAAVARGHEGVVVKSPASVYAAGRRGSEWIKVKPRHTLDLVVLAAEWGHGRRRGWLSNLHLGARDPATGGFVMLGKTFKGLTDEMLAWQTGRLLELASPPGTRPAGDFRDAHGVLRVMPELVVEIAFEGVQSSSRYPGGLALRFARVLRYRHDKTAREADTIDAVRALWEPPAS